MIGAPPDLRTGWRPRTSRAARLVRAAGLVRIALLAPVFSLCACQKAETDPAAGVDRAVEDASPPEALSARRPTRRYYAAHTRDGCEVYSIDGDRVSSRTPIPCPQDFLVGERIRLAGSTCMREGDREPRPVVCPDPLTNLEKVDRGAKR
jgi:hypothetical protein